MTPTFLIPLIDDESPYSDSSTIPQGDTIHVDGTTQHSIQPGSRLNPFAKWPRLGCSFTKRFRTECGQTCPPVKDVTSSPQRLGSWLGTKPTRQALLSTRWNFKNPPLSSLSRPSFPSLLYPSHCLSSFLLSAKSLKHHRHESIHHVHSASGTETVQYGKNHGDGL